MVVLHSMDARAAAGVTRYGRELAEALRAAGEPVREWRVRPHELRIGRRRVGGFLSMRLQGLLRPRGPGPLHSTFHYAAHPRCDVATVHDLFPEERAAELGFAAVEVAALARTTRRLARRGVHFVAVSAATRDRLVQRHGIDAQRVSVASPGISARFRPAAPGRRPHPAFRGDRLHVLCVADLNPRKRFDWLLQAALGVDDDRLHVVHAGPATVRRPPWAQQQAREAPLERRLGALGRLTRLGRVEDAELLAAYQSADLLVLPTLDEGFGFPPLEALSCGTPVAVTDLPVFRETLGGRGARFDGPDGLAGVLERALRQGPPTPGQRQEAHAWVQRRHGWGPAAQRLTQVYRTRLPST